MAAGALPAQPRSKPTRAADAQRRTYSLNRKWLFGGKAPAGFPEPAFNDSKWERVTLPHANVRLPWHSFEEKDFQFVSAYRRHFQALAGWKGKRVFVDFAGAMTAAKVSVNGHPFEEYQGGYTPFSFEITPYLKYGADNLLAVEVDSTERQDIPPFGENIDYLTFGGIYRDVSLRVVPGTFIENVHVRVLRPLLDSRALAVRCYLSGPVATGSKLTAELLDNGGDGDRVLKSATLTLVGDQEFHEVILESLGAVELWEPQHPKLYTVAVRLGAPSGADRYSTRIGIREAKFTPQGFKLNGSVLKLRGLNRHQSFPYLGGAMPERVQRRDAWILRRELHCNIVRTSHYPQAPSFLDACDELGLLVFEETPGWQFVGGAPGRTS